MFRLATIGLAATALSCVATASASAQDFYAGKTVTVIVGSDVGGGYDTYARLFARHLPDVIPGKPNVVVQNMPGAGSARAAGYLYNSSPKDGTTIAILQPGAVVGPLFDKSVKANYDATKLTYLASADSGNRVCITLPDSRIKTFKQAQSQKVIAGAAGIGASSRDYAFLHKNASGAQFEVVSGYKGMADILLAMERKEIDTVCGFDWSSVKAQRPALVRDKKINVLLQAGLERNAEIDSFGAPDAMEVTQGEDNKAMVELVVAQQLFGRPFVMAPGNPDAAVKIMRAAFDAAMTHDKLLADADRMGLAINPATGVKVQEVVQKMYTASPRIVDLTAKAIRE